MIDTKKVQQRIADIAASFRAYLELSQKDKTKITKSDKRRIADLDAELNLILEPQERTEFITDVAGVARFFRVTSRTVQNWVKLQACPKLRHGLYDLGAVHAWWLENVSGGKDSAETENIKVEYWRWKTENEKMKAQQTKGDLVPREDIVSLWSSRVAEVGSGLYALASRLPLLVEGKSQTEMIGVIREEVKKLHENYSRSGRFCPTSEVKSKR